MTHGRRARRVGNGLTRAEFLRRAGLLSAVTAFPGALGGCSAFYGGDTGSAASGLRLFLTTEQRTPSEPMLDRYQRDAGLRLNRTYAETDDLNVQLRTQLSAGEAADIFRVAPGTGAPTALGLLAPDGYLADLSDAPWADLVPDKIAPLATSEGRLYAFAINRGVIATFYNRRAFAAADVEPPRTWDGLLDACRKLKAAGTTPIALGLAEPTNVQLTAYALAATLVFGPTPNFVERMAKGQETFAGSTGWKEALENFHGLFADGLTTKNPLGTPFDQAMRSVALGESAMMTMASPSVAQMAEYASGGFDDLGVFALPATADPGDTVLPASPDLLGVNAASERIGGARKVLEFLAEPAQVNAYAEAANCLPGLDIPDPEPAPLLSSLQRYLDTDRTIPYLNHRWPNPEIQQTLFQYGQQLFSGEADADAVLSAMDRAYSKGGS